MNTIDTNLLYQIANMKGAPSGAFNIRKKWPAGGPPEQQVH